MDILAIQPSTISVDIKHPATGAPIGLQIECTSLEADAVKAVERAIKNRALRGGRNTVTAEKIEDNTVELLSAAIVGWKWADGLTLGDLKNPQLSKINVGKLLAVVWIAKQVDQALGDEAAFFSNSGQSSPST
ncbi:hypothetical protein GGQ99_001287 [Aminobacter niigataensis]|uniref:Uncharacterized protein n=1 Tax=Aminobacter niigataensis TaxID=83265 RepID=A0ABR6KYF0_9HYPH|nr:hypothetical protein [Aminobacter niigataensis]MBB4649565.1 hypothetical protein [Aminobacter niigataensis]